MISRAQVMAMAVGDIGLATNQCTGRFGMVREYL